MMTTTLTRAPGPGPVEYWCGDYCLYQCDVERPNMRGWTLRFDGQLVGYFLTVKDAREWLVFGDKFGRDLRMTS
jgi:hypothetical protein